MEHIEKWIWLPKKDYANHQNTVFSAFQDDKEGNYTVAEFMKDYSFQKIVRKMELRFSGDTALQLYCNQKFVATGPACVGGDFIGNDTVRENYYAFETTLYPDSNVISFFSRVRMMPIQICEYSKGHGGFMLSAILTFEDGTIEVVHTDETWLCTRNGAYYATRKFDGRIPKDSPVYAEGIPDIWKVTTALIPIRPEQEIYPANSHITLNPREEKQLILEFDKIWAGFLHLRAATAGELEVKMYCRELEEDVWADEAIIVGEQEYRGFVMLSTGNILVIAKNKSDEPAHLTVSLMETHYPISEEATTITSDEEINQVLQTCKHTLKICRQTHHLDSPRHCEPMACTGDYNIEAMMTPFAFDDMRLAEFDLIRTARMLERENGRMFHTTYSLIWVKMLYDVFMLTGNVQLLKECEQGLELLLNRFETYIGHNGLIENPPDYMFVDWIYIDEISMHHPPKALGQSCLNMYYFGALTAAEKIYLLLNQVETAKKCVAKRNALQTAINQCLFDPNKGCYFEGLNTPTDPKLIGNWMPQNVEKRYYLKHSNVLAACFGVCDDQTGIDLVHRIMADDIPGDCQPYFLHYLFEAIYRLGLRDQYTVALCNRWKASVKACSKGLVEGFYAPEPTYKFDHSHAWGGTPLYSLPKALLGLEITKPGMLELQLSPSLLGFEHATVELLTPYGKLTCRLSDNREYTITKPDEISVLIV